MAFLETPRFPDCISEGSSGGPQWDTRVVSSAAGYEQRDQRWANSRHTFNAAYGVRDQADLEDLKAFFLGVSGMLHGFRYKDWSDFTSGYTVNAVTPLDQNIGVGNGIQVDFQLIKQYTQSYVYDRAITKPVAGTVRIALDSVEQVSGWTVDTTTGIVTFDAAPGGGVVITAGFEFDVPCRFDSDSLVTNLESYQLGSANVMLVELRL